MIVFKKEYLNKIQKCGIRGIYLMVYKTFNDE